MEGIIFGPVFVFGGIFAYRHATQLRKRTTTARQQGYMLNGEKVSKFWVAVAHVIIWVMFFLSALFVFIGVGNIIVGLFQIF
ncbi:MAG: hypothetical protein AAF787_00775 [Chloroflexota bacterium]